jgi:hypothetical protein
VNLEKVINDLNPVLRGFANYFRVAHCRNQFRDLARWVRRRLRAKQLPTMRCQITGLKIWDFLI